jgi:Raf kinase inhibitor-like YbhB/YbcL family protein
MDTAIMQRNATGLTALLSVTAISSLAFAQQPDPLTDVEIKGFVYEPQPVPPTDERISALKLPAGFNIARFAEGLYNPRMLAVSEDGTLYATQRTPGNLVMLRDVDSDGVVDSQKVILWMKDLHGIAIRGNRMYLVDVTRVYSAFIRPDGSVAEPRVIARNLPDGGQHPNRTIAFGPDGALYVSVGSTCNACDEPNKENATLLRMDPDTGERRIFASGLRNTIGFGWHPAAQRLYGMDQGIDWLGNDHQKEELNEILDGKRYGWPFVYESGLLNPQDEPLKVTQPDWAEMSENPAGLYTAHAAAMQLSFYTGNQFAAEYRNDAFVAMHGSWNRKPSSGYEVVRMRFNASGDFQSFEPFITGFLVPQPKQDPPLPGAQPPPPDGYIGRPTGIAVARDGSLLVGDDSNNMIYRVSLDGKEGTPSPQQLAGEILKPKSSTRLNVQSAAFSAGGPIPEKYSDYGRGVSPPLSWSKPPAGTKAFVLMMEDPAATSPLPFVHWVAVLPSTVTGLPEGVPPLERHARFPGASQGSNSRSTIGYFGPRPPAGSPPHPYHFQIFALDTVPELPSGYNRHALLKAIEGHVLASGDLVGTFARAP